MAVSISISIAQNSQSIANNTSNVTVKVIASWNYGSWNGYSKPGWLKIDGTTYNFTSSFNTGQSTSGSQTLFTKPVNISHAANGTKTLSCSASYTSGVSSGTVTASASKVLTTIPRASDLTVADGTLNTAQTLTISEKASAFTHKLYYSCGNANAYILGSSSATSDALSVSWTPPLSLAEQNTTSAAVSIKFTLETYNGSTMIGYKSYTKTFAIPESVVPSMSFTVQDDTGYLAVYGAYVQSKSKIKIDVTAAGVYGSSISAYNIIADGKTYTTDSITTDIIAGSGTLTVNVTVTDSRGRTKTSSQTIQVLAYEPPKITAMKVKRSDSNGESNSTGAYLTVVFSAEVTALNNKNGAGYIVQYKKVSEATYTSVEVTAYTDNYSVVDGQFTFPADTASSYDVQLLLADRFVSVGRSGSGSSASALFSMFKKGLGWAFGKVAELENTLEVNFEALFYKVATFKDKVVFKAETSFQKAVTIKNMVNILIENANGTPRNVMHMTATNNLKIGYDSYAEAEGSTDICGNYINLMALNGLHLNGKPVIQIEKLWTNASPTSSFAAQTLSLSLNSGSIVCIESRYATTNSRTICTFCLVEQMGEIVRLSSSWTVTFSTRMFAVKTTGIEFGDCAVVTFNGSASTSNAILIPIRIFEIKGVI